MLVPRRLSHDVIWLAPEKAQGISTHPRVGAPPPNRRAIHGREGSEALAETNLPEVHRPLSGRGFGQIGLLL